VLELSRGYVAYLLAGYGEPEASAGIVKSSDADFRRVQEAANQGVIEGKEWLKVACRTAVEIVEGRPRELMAEDNRAYVKRAERFLGGASVKKKEIFAAVSADQGTSTLSRKRSFKSRFRAVPHMSHCIEAGESCTSGSESPTRQERI
jgi:hypothetical protein